MAVADAFQFVAEQIKQMQSYFEHIIEQNERGGQLNDVIKEQLHDNQQKNSAALEKLNKYKDDKDF